MAELHLNQQESSRRAIGDLNTKATRKRPEVRSFEPRRKRRGSREGAGRLRGLRSSESKPPGDVERSSSSRRKHHESASVSSSARKRGDVRHRAALWYKREEPVSVCRAPSLCRCFLRISAWAWLGKEVRLPRALSLSNGRTIFARRSEAASSITDTKLTPYFRYLITASVRDRTCNFS